MVSASSPATSISLTWDQPQGAEAVEGYEINYNYQISECVREGNLVPIPPFLISLNNGSLRSYTIMNSPTTPVEEDSSYTITITAVNSVWRSGPSNTVSTTTAQAGEYLFLHKVRHSLMVFHSPWASSVCQDEFCQCHQHHHSVGPCGLSGA